MDKIPGPNNEDEKFVDPDLYSGKKLFTTYDPRQGNNKKPADEDKHGPKEDGSQERYNWQKIVGQGTFGVVYKAQDKETDKLVAIKKVFQDPNYRNREFTIVKELNHPNNIKVYNYFFTKGEENAEENYLNLVMDYIPETMYRVLRYYAKMKMAFPDALGKIYSYQMFRSQAYIHGLGICHRDIKPQNVLVDTISHRVVMCDFGSAKKLNPGETSVAYICSRYYRAPELILGEEQYCSDIDIWSIGCVIAEMFIGEPIFPGVSSKDQLLKIMQLMGTPTPAEVQAMCRKSKAKLPDIQGIGLKKKLKSGTNPLAIDLLQKLFVYNPKKRLKPLQALMHPYFDDLRGQKLTINGKGITDLFNFTKVELQSEPEQINKLVPKWYIKMKDKEAAAARK